MANFLSGSLGVFFWGIKASSLSSAEIECLNFAVFVGAAYSRDLRGVYRSEIAAGSRSQIKKNFFA
jgi:hypothetical protein